MILWACDRWEAYKGPIKTLFECEDTREVNGENALSITTLARLDKGDRLVWRDLKGRWHENIVDGVEEERASAGILYTYYCPTSAQIELLGDYLEDKRPYDVSAYAALASALSTSGRPARTSTTPTHGRPSTTWQTLGAASCRSKSR